jgi:UDP:flavonoid glycosyltransferase YjiC (YdhE family)
MSVPARFLIATWDGGGNTIPEFNLGSRLARRGHRVRMLGWSSMAGHAAAAGLEFTAYRSVPPWPAGLTQDDGWARMETLLHGAATRDDMLAEAAAFAPDALIIDCMLGAGFDAARQLGLPTAVLVHVLYMPFVRAWGDQVMGTSVAGLLAAADRVLAIVPPGFDEPGQLPANTRYTGPVSRPRPQRSPVRSGAPDPGLLASPGDPWVLLSLSTTLQGQAQALPRMLAAAASLPVRVLLTLGGAVPAAAVDAPPNVTVCDFVPHELVLPHMAAVISHGGLSTIMASLTAGIPMLCIPQGREQPINAARVAACGVGRVVPPASTAAEIAAAIDGLLRDEPAQAAARRFAATIAALGAGERAADEVERLAGSQHLPRPGPHVTGSHVTGPHVTGPHVTGPHVTGPHLTGRLSL